MPPLPPGENVDVAAVVLDQRTADQSIEISRSNAALGVWLGRIGIASVAFFLFVLAIELLKSGAGGLKTVFSAIGADNVLNTMGIGWLMAYCVLSGSPVAAIALTLYGSSLIADTQTLTMIAGSRFGASFIVLMVGLIYYLRGNRGQGVVSVGVLALLTTWTIYIPATCIGYIALTSHSLDSFRFGSPAVLTSLIDYVYDPLMHAASSYAPRPLLFIMGVAVLLSSFHLFDRALPKPKSETPLFVRASDFVNRPWVLFGVGMLVTSLTLSVSVSLSLMVPLAARGYLRRENAIPYIMGANITTFLDTLFASMLIGVTRAFTVVLCEMLSVMIVSLVILTLFYPSYEKALLRAMLWITRSRRNFLLFACVLFLVPAVLLLF